MTFTSTLTEINEAAASDVVAFDTIALRDADNTITWNEGDLARVGTGDNIHTYVYDGVSGMSGPFTSNIDDIWKRINGAGRTASRIHTLITASTRSVTMSAGTYKLSYVNPINSQSMSAFPVISAGAANLVEGSGFATYPGLSTNPTVGLIFDPATDGFTVLAATGTTTTTTWTTGTPLRVLGEGLRAGSLLQLEFTCSGPVTIGFTTSFTGGTLATYGPLIVNTIT